MRAGDQLAALPGSASDDAGQAASDEVAAGQLAHGDAVVDLETVLLKQSRDRLGEMPLQINDLGFMACLCKALLSNHLSSKQGGLGAWFCRLAITG